MLLVNIDLHQAVRHWGGVRTTKVKNMEGPFSGEPALRSETPKEEKAPHCSPGRLE